MRVVLILHARNEFGIICLSLMLNGSLFVVRFLVLKTIFVVICNCCHGLFYEEKSTKFVWLCSGLIAYGV